MGLTKTTEFLREERKPRNDRLSAVSHVQLVPNSGLLTLFYFKMVDR